MSNVSCIVYIIVSESERKTSFNKSPAKLVLAPTVLSPVLSTAENMGLFSNNLAK